MKPHTRSRAHAEGCEISRAETRRALGRAGEQIAVGHLQRLGFRVLARNLRTRYGEIDAIAFDGRTLVFAEVKTRRAGSRVRLRPDEDPLLALRGRQRARLRRLASAWLRDPARPRVKAPEIRFDAIGVVVDRDGALVRLEHVEGAW